jgi:hypothetical protein
MRKQVVSDEEILSTFKFQGMATTHQIAELLNINYQTATRLTKNIWLRETRLFNRTTARRPWNVGEKKNGAPEVLYYLNEDGARVVSELTGDKLIAPSMVNKKNVVHALALVDIVNICLKMGGTVRVNRRIYSDEDDTYIRPDIELSPKSDRKYFIELEQSRVKLGLENKILDRMRRWQKILTEEPGSGEYFNEIFVLFNLEESDNYTLAMWAKAYESLYKEINTPPAFIVWYKPFPDFYTAPSFHLNDYTRLQMGDVHLSRVLSEQTVKDTKALLAQPKFDREAIDIRLKNYFLTNKNFLHQMRMNNGPQEFFFSEVLSLHKMATTFDDEYRGFSRSALPYLGIGLVRTWLESPDLIDLRTFLIEALSSVQSSYTRGLNAAAAALERMIWNVLLRYFGFDRNGPLNCGVQIGSNEQGKERSNDLIPFVSISIPWEGVCNDVATGKEMELALTWFIDLLFRYTTELGLEKPRRKRHSIS